MLNNFGLTQKDAISSGLHTALSDLVVLAAKTRFYHWSLRGDLFFDLHAQFGELYTFLNDKVDDFAERLRTLGYVPRYGLANHETISSIPMMVSDLENPINMSREYVMDSYFLLAILRHLAATASQATDYGTEVLAKELIASLEKYNWKFSTFATEIDDESESEDEAASESTGDGD